MTDETNTNRWTAEVKWERFRGVRMNHPFLSPRSIWCSTEEQATALAEQINRPAPTAPADDLPPGVERISDGTLWIRLDPDRTEKVLPDDYEWLSDTAVEMDEPVMVQVRPITAEPATEWVPCDESCVGKVATKTGDVITSFHGDGTKRWAITHPAAGPGWDTVDARPDGMVEVQR